MKDKEQADLAVVIGRFQPFHLGHLALVEHALALAPRLVLVLSSAGGPRLAENPFTAEERSRVIRESLTPEQQSRVSVTSVREYYDEARWAEAVQAVVLDAAGASQSAASIVLVAADADASSCLERFPNWRTQSVPRRVAVQAAPLRRQYFGAAAALAREWVAAVPPAVAQFLAEFRGTAHFERLREERAVLDATRQKYGSGPFITVDAVVTQSDRILLVQRGGAPGKGTWALPGGFLEGSERLLTAALRELREETLVACSDAELRAAFRGVAVFDHPRRSQRGRTITHAHYFALPPSTQAPPRVQGSDDARAAEWLPLEQLPHRIDELFEDHYRIIEHFLPLGSVGDSKA